MGLYTREQLIEKLLEIEDNAYGWHINEQVLGLREHHAPSRLYARGGKDRYWGRRSDWYQCPKEHRKKQTNHQEVKV